MHPGLSPGLRVGSSEGARSEGRTRGAAPHCPSVSPVVWLRPGAVGGALPGVLMGWWQQGRLVPEPPMSSHPVLTCDAGSQAGGAGTWPRGRIHHPHASWCALPSVPPGLAREGCWAARASGGVRVTHHPRCQPCVTDGRGDPGHSGLISLVSRPPRPVACLSRAGFQGRGGPSSDFLPTWPWQQVRACCPPPAALRWGGPCAGGRQGRPVRAGLAAVLGSFGLREPRGGTGSVASLPGLGMRP